MSKQEGDRRFAGQLRRLLPVLCDLSDVHVGDEVVGVGAPEHEHLDGLVGLSLLNEGDQIADQLGSQKIHGRGRDLREQHGPVMARGKRFEPHVATSLAGLHVPPLIRLLHAAQYRRAQAALRSRPPLLHPITLRRYGTLVP